MSDQNRWPSIKPVEEMGTQDRVFINHIQRHLLPGQEVVCKICGLTAKTIIRQESPVAESRRSEEEIRRAIRWFQSMLADSNALWGVSACVDLIKWMQGQENGWSKLFAPSGSNQDTEEKPEGKDEP